MKSSLVYGLGTPFRAVGFLLSNLGLSRYFIIPFGINILIFGTGTWAFIHYYSDLLHALISNPDVWYQYILYYAVAVVLGLVFALLIVFGFTIIGNLIASPFLDVLSEKTEEKRSGKKIEEPFSFKVLVGDAKAAVGNEIKKIGILILIQVILLLFNFIPVIGNIIYVIASPVFVTYFLAFEYLDFTMSRKRMPFGEKWNILKQNKSACMGMGASFFFTTIVPFINFFVMPIAVIGATLLYHQIVEGSNEPRIDDSKVNEVVDDVLSHT